MLTFKELYSILKTTNFEHPIFEAYRIQVTSLNEQRYALQIEHLMLFIEKGHPNIEVGTIKWLKEEGNPSQNKEALFINDQAYRIQANLALLTPEQEKEFKKEYKHALHQFKKALKDYEKLSKKQQKAAIKTARQVEIPPQA